MMPMSLNRSEIAQFKLDWQDVVDNLNISELHDFAGQNTPRKNNKPYVKIPCYMLWRSMFILWNGDVTICCMDYDGEYIVGNVNNFTLKEIWESSRFRHIRSQHLRGKLKLCERCHVNKIRQHENRIQKLKLWIK